MFLDNKYTKLYFKIIERSRGRTKKSGIYYEEHHIIPESFYLNRSRRGHKGWIEGDPESPQNKTLLTAREHFICHYLLTKMTTGKGFQKAVKALNAMTTMKNGNVVRAISSSKLYASAKKIYADHMREWMRERMLGPANFARGRKRSAVSIERQKATRRENGKHSWNKGMSMSDEHKTLLSQAAAGERNPMYGKSHSNETKRKISESKIGKENKKLQGKKKSQTHKKKISESLIGKVPTTDRTVYHFTHISGIEEHCTRSELVRKYNLNSGAICNLVRGTGRVKSHKGWSLCQ